MPDANSTEMDENTPHPLIFSCQKDHVPYGWYHEIGADPQSLVTTVMIQLSVSAEKLSSTPRFLFTKRGLSMAHKYMQRPLASWSKVIQERHRHRYEVNPEYIERIEAKMKFVAKMRWACE